MFLIRQDRGQEEYKMWTCLIRKYICGRKGDATTKKWICLELVDVKPYHIHVAGNLGGANFHIDVCKAFRRNFHIFIFIYACTLPHPLQPGTFQVWTKVTFISTPNFFEKWWIAACLPSSEVYSPIAACCSGVNWAYSLLACFVSHFSQPRWHLLSLQG